MNGADAFRDESTAFIKPGQPDPIVTPNLRKIKLGNAPNSGPTHVASRAKTEHV